MKTLLVEITCPDIRAFGVRSLSAFIKAAGHPVDLLFLPPMFEQLRPESGTVLRYPDTLIADFLGFAKQYDLIGISFMTYYFDRAVQLTEAVHGSLPAPVVWGGIHASNRPEESLQYADFACVGEGEEAIVELIETLQAGRNPGGIANIWSRHDGQVIANPVRPLIPSIDTLPFPDYELETHYAYSIFDDKIVPLNERLMQFFSLAGPLNRLGTFYQYKTMASRGCPHSCTYCCNSIYREMYQGQRYLRWRSLEKIFEELETVIRKVPYFNSVMFFDDSFFALPPKQMKRFAEEYKTRIGLPFATQSSPQTTSEEKMEYLIDAGMVYLEMGIQTGSDRINSLYQRRQTKEQVLKAARVINRFTDRMLPPDYHLILDNNWETDEDVLETLDLVLQIPRPFGLKPSSLVLYPGTKLFTKAMGEGLIHDEKFDVYRKAFGAPKSTYLNFLILLVSYSFVPLPVIRFFRKPLFIRLFKRPLARPVVSFLRIVIHQVARVINKFQRTWRQLVQRPSQSGSPA